MTAEEIQALIDAAIAAGGGIVHLPAGDHVLSDTIHLGYGDQYARIILEGEPGTSLRPTFNDRPVINVQGTRESGVRCLTIVGPTPGAGIGGADGREALYDTIGTHGRYNPFCGIAIDAYSGDPPAGEGRYPGQYGRTHYSSRVRIDDVNVYHCAAGLVTKPGGDDNNGDFMTLTNFQANYCKYGVSVNHVNSRLFKIVDCAFYANYACITGGIHGIQRHQDFHVINTSFGGFKAFDLRNVQWCHVVRVEGCYAEELCSLGDFYNGASCWGRQLIFTGNHFVLNAATIPEDTPQYHLWVRSCDLKFNDNAVVITTGDPRGTFRIEHPRAVSRQINRNEIAYLRELAPEEYPMIVTDHDYLIRGREDTCPSAFGSPIASEVLYNHVHTWAQTDPSALLFDVPLLDEPSPPPPPPPPPPNPPGVVTRLIQFTTDDSGTTTEDVLYEYPGALKAGANVVSFSPSQSETMLRVR